DELKSSLNSREDLMRLSYEEKSANMSYSAAKGNLAPAVNGYAKYMTNNTFPNINNDYGSYFVGIALKYSIFDGGKDSSEREKARLTWAQSSLQVTKAKEEADLALEKAYLTVKTKNKIFIEKKKSSELADAIDEKYQIMYENALTPLSERLKKLAEKTEARAQMIGANADEINAIGELRIYSGLDLMEAK
ncbi:MAG: hypothetical protein RL154_1644, partial [Pseudomonadota bacterium]